MLYHESMKNTLEALKRFQEKHDYLKINFYKVPDKVYYNSNHDDYSTIYGTYGLHKDVHVLSIDFGELGDYRTFQCNLIIPEDYTQEDINKILNHVFAQAIHQTALRGVSKKELYEDIKEIFYV